MARPNPRLLMAGLGQREPGHIHHWLRQCGFCGEVRAEAGTEMRALPGGIGLWGI